MATQQEARAMGLVTAGTGAEAIGGLGVVVLSILGLTGLAPTFMMGISAIILGSAFLVHGGAIAAEFSSVRMRAATGGLGATELGGGISVEFIAGLAAVVLGILSLVQVVPAILLPASAIVVGAALVLGSGVVSRLASLRTTASVGEAAAEHLALSGAAGAQVLIGFAVAVLGLLAIIGLAPAVLTLVAYLAAGCATLISGSVTSGGLLALNR